MCFVKSWTYEHNPFFVKIIKNVHKIDMLFLNLDSNNQFKN